jgi:kynurenine formamidase
MRYLFILSTLLLVSCHKNSNKNLDLNDLNWIDLTHSFDSTTLYWPNNKTKFIHHTDAEGVTPLGYYYSSYSICAPEHGGTHLDAPIHFAKNKYTVEELPLNSLTGNAVVIDVSKNALANRDYQIAIADLKRWEMINGKIEKNKNK